jgi:hypothetical protein
MVEGDHLNLLDFLRKDLSRTNLSIKLRNFTDPENLAFLLSMRTVLWMVEGDHLNLLDVLRKDLSRTNLSIKLRNFTDPENLRFIA